MKERIGGRLTEKLKEENEQIIRCEVWIKNQKDEKVVVGYTTVTC